MFFSNLDFYHRLFMGAGAYNIGQSVRLARMTRR